MEEVPHASRNTSRWALWSVVLVVSAMALYVLSVGPVNAWAARPGWALRHQPSLKRFYAPLCSLERSGLLADAIWNYENWCDYLWGRWWDDPPLDPFQYALFDPRRGFR